MAEIKEAVGSVTLKPPGAPPEELPDLFTVIEFAPFSPSRYAQDADTGQNDWKWRTVRSDPMPLEDVTPFLIERTQARKREVSAGDPHFRVKIATDEGAPVEPVTELRFLRDPEDD